MTKRVLVVEDDPDDLYLLRQDLEARGYEPIAVQSGLEALVKAVETPPDIIILDVGLPGLDGWEILQRLQAQPATADIPVVMLTGHDDSEDLIRAYSSGAAYFIPKPYREEELFRGIEIALTQGRKPTAQGVRS